MSLLGPLADEAALQRPPELRCRGDDRDVGGRQPLSEVSAGGEQEGGIPSDQREGRAEPPAGGARPGEGGAEERQDGPGGAEEAAGPSPGEDEQRGS